MSAAEMEKWRHFFGQCGEDLWTVIDWALTIAAANYPQELRLRRDGFAEKLFGPPIFPPVSSNCDNGTALTGSEVRDHNDNNNNITNSNKHSRRRHESGEEDEDEEDGREEDQDRLKRRMMNSNAAASGEAVTEGHESEMEEVLRLKSRLYKCSSMGDSAPVDEIVEPLQRLREMRLSVKTLKDTEIGKVVNDLRRHKSKRVKSAAKSLVRLWMDMVDEWVKTADVDAAAEIAARNARNEDVDPVCDDDQDEFEDDRRLRNARAACSDASQMLENTENTDELFAEVPEEEYRGYRTRPEARPELVERCQPSSKAYNGYHVNARAAAAPAEQLHAFRPEPRASSNASMKAAAAAAVPPKRPPDSRRLSSQKPTKPSSPECGSVSEKLAAAKRKLHEGYQQAANAKKQRTVQVMGLGDVPPEGHKQANNKTSAVRKLGQR